MKIKKKKGKQKLRLRKLINEFPLNNITSRKKKKNGKTNQTKKKKV